MRPNLVPRIAGETNPDAIRGPSALIHAFLRACNTGGAPAEIHQLHAALQALPADARGPEYANVQQALEEALEVTQMQQDVARAVAEALDEFLLLPDDTARTPLAYPKAVAILDSAMPDQHDRIFQRRMQDATRISRMLASIERNRFGVDAGPLFQSLSDAYSALLPQQSFQALRDRLSLLSVAVATYDRQDDQRNIAWVNGTIIGYGGRLVAPEAGQPAPEPNDQALNRIVAEINEALTTASPDFAALCAQADRAWGKYGITVQGMQRSAHLVPPSVTELLRRH